tara:strand:- start:1578 stop:2585 length:1008 start_codon:yes stop_codon:yes gene_type:complete
MTNYQRDDYLMLFASCIPVKGVKRSILYDLQRNNFEYIPNDLFNFIEKTKSLPLNLIIQSYGTKNKNHIFEYVDFIIQNEFGFIEKKEKKDCFIPLELDWETPSVISNAILDKIGVERYCSIPNKLNILGCEHLYIIEEDLSLIEIEVILRSFSLSRVNSIRLRLIRRKDTPIVGYEALLKKYKRLDVIFLKVRESEKLDNSNDRIKLFIDENSKLPLYNYFSINVEMFTEAIAFNPYFNRKMYINSKGDVKNALETQEIFGKIDDLSATDLIDIVNTSKFQEYWKTSKNSIKICSDCEYRYMCLDNRLPRLNREEEWEYSSDCTYNPYKTFWDA